MSDTTAISWCDATFNPWWGCQKVSPACDHCYAERDAKRFASSRVLWGVDSERRTFDDKHWALPLKWAKTMPTKLGRRPRVFCASMGDWLDLDAPLVEFVRLLDTVRLTPELDWLLLSKRIGNWRKRLTESLAAIGDRAEAPALWDWITGWLNGDAPANVWLGATVINQAEADRDIPKLLAVPARVRFLSIEPMLGPIDLRNLPSASGVGCYLDALSNGGVDPGALIPGAIDWVIAGGESGPHARPAHPDWFRSLRDQCAAAGVPFHFKQWGEWATAEESAVHPEATRIPGNLCRVTRDGVTADHYVAISDGGGHRRYEIRRVGKKAAGRLLDGVEHNGFPAPLPPGQVAA